MLYILLGQHAELKIPRPERIFNSACYGWSNNNQWWLVALVGKKFHHREKLHSVAHKHLVLSKDKLPRLIVGAFLNQAPTRIFLVLPHTTLIQLIQFWARQNYTTLFGIIQVLSHLRSFIPNTPFGVLGVTSSLKSLFKFYSSFKV